MVTAGARTGARHRRSGDASARRPDGFRTDIQGLRAIAVLGVVLYHAGVPGLDGGYVGVDVFFVISGYLITDQMQRRLDRTGTVRFRDFWARRVRRLFPAAFVVLLATVVLSKLFDPPLTLVGESRAGAASSLYLGNVLFGLSGINYLADPAPSAFQHMWSLGVEEQFYLFWPLIVVLAGGRRFRGSRRRQVIVLAAITLASFALCVYLTRVLVPIAFFTLPTRAWEFGVGALLVFLRPWLSARAAALGGAVTWAGAGLLTVSYVLLTGSSQFPGYLAALPVLGAALVIAGGENAAPWSFGAVLHVRPMQFFGAISYSLYLWHWPLLIVPANYHEGPLPPLTRAALVVASVLLGWVTFRFVEEPGRRTARMRNAPGRVLLVGAATSVVCLLASLALGVLPKLTSDRPVAAPTAQGLRGSPPVPSVVPANLTPTLTGANDDLPVTYRDGCHQNFRGTESPRCTYGRADATRTMVLYGDSRANQWFPAVRAIAERQGMRLVSFTKSACPSFDLSVENPVLGGHYDACDEWRANTVRRIAALRPDLVVLANFSRGYKLYPGTRRSGFDDRWAAAGARTLRALPDAGRVLVLGDTPYWPGIAPNTCLSAHLEDAAHCSEARDDLVDTGLLATMQRGVTGAGGHYADTASWLCGSRCYSIAWNVLMYHDAVHLTTTMVRLLTPRIEGALRSAATP